MSKMIWSLLILYPSLGNLTTQIARIWLDISNLANLITYLTCVQWLSQGGARYAEIKSNLRTNNKLRNKMLRNKFWSRIWIFLWLRHLRNFWNASSILGWNIWRYVVKLNSNSQKTFKCSLNIYLASFCKRVLISSMVVFCWITNDVFTFCAGQ